MPLAIKYPFLPQGRVIKYVSASDPFMHEALLAQALSSDLVQPIGAVIVLGGNVIGRGANQSVLRNKWLLSFHKKVLCTRRLLKTPSGKKYWLCPGCSSPSSHAEPQAIQNALIQNAKITGADLYLYGHWWCCESCWDKMIEAGIRDVYLLGESATLFKK